LGAGLAHFSPRKHWLPRIQHGQVSCTWSGRHRGSDFPQVCGAGRGRSACV